MLPVALFLLVSLVVGYVLLKNVLKVRRAFQLLADVPNPKGVPIFGNALDFRDGTKILDKFCADVKKYGGLVNYRIFWLNSLLISDYEHIEAILSTTRVLNKSEEYEYFEKWLGTGLLTSGPEKWKKTRKIITPTFHFQILDQFIEVFESCSDILVGKLLEQPNKSNINIYELEALCALDVICESAMGTKVNAQLKSESKYVQSVKELSRILRERIFSPMKMFNATYYFTEDYNNEKQAMKILHDYTNSVIQKRREELLRNNNDDDGLPSKRKRLAFLDLLLQSQLDNRPMTDEEIRQEVDTFMFEGHDTTAFAVSCTLYCLGKHPDIQRKVVDEIKEVFGNDIHRAANHNDLQNLKYLEMVIKESLRLYPSVPFFGRKVLEETQLGSTTIPADVSCVIFVWGLHRNPEIYPDPERFDPERFTQENQNSRGPFSYIPFSAGPRNCIGQRFAMLEMKSTISKVLKNFEITQAPNFEPVWLPDLIMKPMYGIEIALEPRKL